MVSAWFDVLGGQLTTVEVPPYRTMDDSGQWVQQPLGQAIHIGKWPAANRRILLCIHMDTVYPDDHPFQSCRWLDDGRLNGPGVADAKGGLIVMLYALRTLELSPLAGRVGWEVIINADEELGSPGSHQFLQHRARYSQCGLLFEPTMPDGSLVSWRKGTGNFIFVVRGRAAHSGREFDKGRNAVVACSRLMDEIDRLNGDSQTTFNVGRISGGGPLNIVPDLAIGRVNVRVKTLADQQLAEQRLAHLVANFNKLDGISVEQHGGISSPPKEIEQRDLELQRRIECCGQAIGVAIRWQGSGGASDGNKFSAAGLPNVDSLGPVGGNIHSADEYLLTESLVPRAKLASLVLLSFGDD
jgi:glutamate carboxypeptidase